MLVAGVYSSVFRFAIPRYANAKRKRTFSRKEDIPGLCEVTVCRDCKRLEGLAEAHQPGGSPEVMKCAFPGNIPELRNVLERAHILGRREEISADELTIDCSDRIARLPEDGDARLDSNASARRRPSRIAHGVREAISHKVTSIR